MLAKILISPNLGSRVEEIAHILDLLSIKKEHPDLLYFSDVEKLGVEASKKIRQHLSLKAYSAKGRVVVIESAHNLTLDSQNALLKTLEEPPFEAVILLGSEKEEALLPTVLSRCEVVRVGKGVQSEELRVKNEENVARVLEMSLEERFKFVEKLEEREEFLVDLMHYFRGKLKENQKYLRINKLLLEAEEWKKSNVNIRAILEYIMLELP